MREKLGGRGRNNALNFNNSMISARFDLYVYVKDLCWNKAYGGRDIKCM